jgi:uncharacterized membrane protein YcjF (UPF0283 family)
MNFDQKPPKKLMSPVTRLLSAIISIPCLMVGAQLIYDAFERPEIDYFWTLVGLVVVATGLSAIVSAIWPLWWVRKSN